MQPLEALRREGGGLGGRVGAEHGRLVHVALFEAHALAVLEVDGGKEDHDAGSPKRLAVDLDEQHPGVENRLDDRKEDRCGDPVDAIGIAKQEQDRPDAIRQDGDLEQRDIAAKVARPAWRGDRAAAISIRVPATKRMTPITSVSTPSKGSGWPGTSSSAETTSTPSSSSSASMARLGSSG